MRFSGSRVHLDELLTSCESLTKLLDVPVVTSSIEKAVRQSADRWQNTRRSIDDVMTRFAHLLPKWEGYDDELAQVRDVIDAQERHVTSLLKQTNVSTSQDPQAAVEAATVSESGTPDVLQGIM